MCFIPSFLERKISHKQNVLFFRSPCTFGAVETNQNGCARDRSRVHSGLATVQNVEWPIFIQEQLK